MPGNCAGRKAARSNALTVLNAPPLLLTGCGFGDALLNVRLLSPNGRLSWHASLAPDAPAAFFPQFAPSLTPANHTRSRAALEQSAFKPHR